MRLPSPLKQLAVAEVVQDLGQIVMVCKIFQIWGNYSRALFLPTICSSNVKDLFWVKGREHQKCVLISPEGRAELLRLLNWLFYIQIQNSRVGENE